MMGLGSVLIQPLLQKNLCGNGINVQLRIAGRLPGLLQTLFGLGRAQSFIDPGHRQVEPAMQLIAETTATLSHLMCCAIQIGGQADHQLFRLPFGQQRTDLFKALRDRLAGKQRQRMRQASQRFAHGNTNAHGTKIKAHHRALRHDQPHQTVGQTQYPVSPVRRADALRTADQRGSHHQPAH